MPSIEAQYRDGDIRLVGGSYQWEGRVEIYFSGTWGTITDSQWTSNDAQAVCRKMGYFKPGMYVHCYSSVIVMLIVFFTGATQQTVAVVIVMLIVFFPGATQQTGGYFGAGSDPIHFDDVVCSGREYNLTDCQLRNGTRQSNHTEDVGVKCQTSKLNSPVILC